ncbi:MAG: hypothetical protein LBM93_09060 [Oscillospiraceae bacterium]|jgi:hypothetical protein|nr:hypothetical protein [Oscillospiraceae bacterium]
MEIKDWLQNGGAELINNASEILDKGYMAVTGDPSGIIPEAVAGATEMLKDNDGALDYIESKINTILNPEDTESLEPEIDPNDLESEIPDPDDLESEVAAPDVEEFDTDGLEPEIEDTDNLEPEIEDSDNLEADLTINIDEDGNMDINLIDDENISGDINIDENGNIDGDIYINEDLSPEEQEMADAAERYNNSDSAEDWNEKYAPELLPENNEYAPQANDLNKDSTPDISPETERIPEPPPEIDISDIR